ncbi:HtaA domain-containing protein [Streptomyces sp. NPDC012623]|uniref:HtaA domain-containing protein n=1 Tax=unclassified Streptomyces TaxID=2593676 RepID=UPI003673B9C9
MLPFRPVRAFVVALLLALPVALLPATGAQAAERVVRGGRLDWGIKSSFQSYITGPVAQGSWTLAGGAATVGGSQFRFHSASGTYDPTSGAFRSAFSGGVHFTGHRTSDGTNELDLTISNPTVRISGGSGTLYADMVSKARGSGKVTTSTQVAFASLGLSGIDMRGGGSPVALNNVPATLTSQGATAFAGYYTAGTELDPVSLSVDVEAEKRPARSTEPTATATASTEPSSPATATKPVASFRDAAVDWGVRRTYREYVTGSIAQGEWTLSGGAQDGGALFRFPKGEGTYDAEKGTLDAVFAGRVRFTGTGLDLTLSEVAVKVKDGKGTLYAKVTDAAVADAEGADAEAAGAKAGSGKSGSGGKSGGGKAVPLVTFTAEDFTPQDGLASLTEAPAKLTARGATAFGSLYPAGTRMDPVSLAVTTGKKAQLPALPDLGSAPTATASASPSAAPAATATGPADPSATASASSSAAGAGTYAAVGAGVLVAAGAAFLVVRGRRRGATDPTGQATSGSGHPTEPGPAGPGAAGPGHTGTDAT